MSKEGGRRKRGSFFIGSPICNLESQFRKITLYRAFRLRKWLSGFFSSFFIGERTRDRPLGGKKKCEERNNVKTGSERAWCRLELSTVMEVEEEEEGPEVEGGRRGGGGKVFLESVNE